MALNVRGDVRELSFCLSLKSQRVVQFHSTRHGMFGNPSSSGQLDVDRVCSASGCLRGAIGQSLF